MNTIKTRHWTTTYVFKRLNPTLLFAAALSMNAQDVDTIPIAASIQSAPIQLGSPLGEVVVKYSVSGATAFHYPVYKLTGASFSSSAGQEPIVDANGRLRLPVNATQIGLTVTLYDLLRNSENLAQITGGISNRPDVPKGTVFRFPEMSSGRSAQLVLIDPNDQSKAKVLAQVENLAGSEANPFPVANFLLDAASLALLRAGPFQVKAENVQIRVSERYRARFQTTDLEVSLSQVESAVNQVRQRLTPLPDGRRAGLLLSPKVPIGLVQSGTIEAHNDLATSLRRVVELEVLQRQGAIVDPALAIRFLDEALAFARQQAAIDLQISAEERENAVATFILDDDLTVTLPLGRLDEVATEIRSDQQREIEKAFLDVVTRNGESSFNAGGGGGFSIAGVSLNATGNKSRTDKWNNQNYRSSKLKDFSRYLDEAATRISGNSPYLTGIRFSVDGRVENLRFNELRTRLGTFVNGFATLETTRDLKEISEQLDAAQRFETLLVPKVLVGSVTTSAPSSQWKDVYPPDNNSGLWRFHSETVTFERSFGETPRVIVALSIIGSESHVRWTEAFAYDVTPEGFTFFFQCHPDDDIALIRGSWIAVGSTEFRPTASGLPSTFGSKNTLITSEARAWAQTPQLRNPAITAERGVNLTFNSIPGRNYLVEASRDLENWSPVRQIPALDFTTMLVLGKAEQSHEFYRVAAE